MEIYAPSIRTQLSRKNCMMSQIHTSVQRTIEAMASKFVLTRFGATALPSKISVVLAPPLAEP